MYRSVSTINCKSAISNNGENSSIVRQALLPNISQNKWQSCIHYQHERSLVIKNI